MTVESVIQTSGEERWWIDWTKDVEDGAARWEEKSNTTEKVYISLLFFFFFLHCSQTVLIITFNR